MMDIPFNNATYSIFSFAADVAKFLQVNELARNMFIDHHIEHVTKLVDEQGYVPDHETLPITMTDHIITTLDMVIRTKEAIDLLLVEPYRMQSTIPLHVTIPNLFGSNDESDDDSDE